MSDMDRVARIMAKLYGQYRSRPAKLDEVERICQLGLRELGPDHVSADTLRSRMNENPNVLQLVEKVGDSAVSLAGYTVLYPLRASVTKRILNGELYRGFQLQPGDISKTFVNVPSLYIGIIYGRREGYDRAAMLLDLRERIQQVVRSSRKPPILFARPGTVRGRYWMNAMDFTPIDLEHSEIWKVDANRVGEMFG